MYMHVCTCVRTCIFVHSISYNLACINTLTQTHLDRFVRARHYRYWYTKLGSKEAGKGQWWRRKLIGDYLPAVSAHQLRATLQSQGWTWYNRQKN